MNKDIEVLDPAFTSRTEAAPLLKQAQRHFQEARRATIQVMADLRQLQDRGVHLLYGEPNFSNWAAETFEGLSAGSVKQLIRAGGVALVLDKYGRIDLKRPQGIGTTGLRSLSVIANDYGNAKMLEVFDTAKGMVEDGKEISDTTIKAAMQLLMPAPAIELEIPESLPEDPDQDDSESEEVVRSELEERISHIQDLLWDVGDGDENAYAEAMEEMQRLGRVIRGEATPEDEAWLASGR